MATRRTLYLTVDTGRAGIIGAYDQVLNEGDWWLFNRDQNLLCFTLQYSTDGGTTFTPFPISETAVMQFGIKAENDFGGALLAFSDNDQWNVPGDWALASRAGGKCSVRVDLNTVALAAALGNTTPSITAVAEIQIQEPGEEAMTILQAKITLKNDVIRGDEGDPAPTTPPYATTAYVDAALSVYFERDGDDLWIVIDGIRVHKFSKP